MARKAHFSPVSGWEMSLRCVSHEAQCPCFFSYFCQWTIQENCGQSKIGGYAKAKISALAPGHQQWQRLWPAHLNDLSESWPQSLCTFAIPTYFKSHKGLMLCRFRAVLLFFCCEKIKIRPISRECYRPKQYS